MPCLSVGEGKEGEITPMKYTNETDLQAVIEKMGKSQVTMLFSDRPAEKARLAIGRCGGLIRMMDGSRKYGRDFVWTTNLLAVYLQDESARLTPAQAYVEDLRKTANFLATKGDPTIWLDLRKEYANMDEALLSQLSVEPGSHYDAWCRAGVLHLPRRERYKTTTLKSNEAPAHVLDTVRKAIDAKQPFNVSWRGKYDYSAEGHIAADGVYHAFFAQEFKGCGNGHYWLLISAENALFCEDD